MAKYFRGLFSNFIAVDMLLQSFGKLPVKDSYLDGRSFFRYFVKIQYSVFKLSE